MVKLLCRLRRAVVITAPPAARQGRRGANVERGGGERDPLTEGSYDAAIACWRWRRWCGAMPRHGDAIVFLAVSAFVLLPTSNSTSRPITKQSDPNPPDRPAAGANIYSVSTTSARSPDLAQPRPGSDALNEARATNLALSAHETQAAVDLGLPGAALCGAAPVQLANTGRCSGIEGHAVNLSISDPAQVVSISLVAFAVAGLAHPIAYQFYLFASPVSRRHGQCKRAEVRPAS